MLKNVKWGEFKLGELFDIERTLSFNSDMLTAGNEYDYVTRTSLNQGVLQTTGFINIENSVFLVDLKVFAVSILAIAIGVFEYAYKKDSGKIAIYGIETLILAFAMLAFIYLDIMCHSNFVIITVLITYTIAIYYTVKSIIIYQKMKKQYYINSMKEIIKK